MSNAERDGELKAKLQSGLHETRAARQDAARAVYDVSAVEQVFGGDEKGRTQLLDVVVDRRVPDRIAGTCASKRQDIKKPLVQTSGFLFKLYGIRHNPYIR